MKCYICGKEILSPKVATTTVWLGKCKVTIHAHTRCFLHHLGETVIDSDAKFSEEQIRKILYNRVTRSLPKENCEKKDPYRDFATRKKDIYSDFVAWKKDICSF